METKGEKRIIDSTNPCFLSKSFLKLLRNHAQFHVSRRIVLSLIAQLKHDILSRGSMYPLRNQWLILISHTLTLIRSPDKHQFLIWFDCCYFSSPWTQGVRKNKGWFPDPKLSTTGLPFFHIFPECVGGVLVFPDYLLLNFNAHFVRGLEPPRYLVFLV